MVKSKVIMSLMSLAAMVALGAAPVAAQGDSQTMAKDYYSAIYAKELCGPILHPTIVQTEGVAPPTASTAGEMTVGQDLMRDEAETFDQTQYNKLGVPIASKTGIDMTAGQRLILVDEAKASVDNMVGLNHSGCKSEEVTRLLKLYDTDLAPALQ